MPMKRANTMFVTADEVRLHECPACGALPGMPCSDKAGEARSANHRERITVARLAKGRWDRA